MMKIDCVLFQQRHDSSFTHLCSVFETAGAVHCRLRTLLLQTMKCAFPKVLKLYNLSYVPVLLFVFQLLGKQPPVLFQNQTRDFFPVRTLTCSTSYRTKPLKLTKTYAPTPPFPRLYSSENKDSSSTSVSRLHKMFDLLCKHFFFNIIFYSDTFCIEVHEFVCVLSSAGL